MNYFTKSLLLSRAKWLSFVCGTICSMQTGLGYGQAFTSIQKITAEERQKHGNFGISVDVSEEYAIVGSYNAGHDSLNKPNGSGLAHIFKVDSNGTWQQEQELVGSDSHYGRQFGRHVAISKNYAIVSTRTHYLDENGKNKLPYSGGAFVFEKGEDRIWKQVQKLVAFDREEKAYFGHSVDIGGDFIVVGAYHESKDVNGSNRRKNAGAAYVYKRDSIGTWQLHQKLVANDRKTDSRFGVSVQVYGETIVIGAHTETHDQQNKFPQNNAGAVYIFNQNSTGKWEQSQKITPPVRLADDWFGSQVCLQENHLIIGAYMKDLQGIEGQMEKRAGAAYIYRKGIDGWWRFNKQLTAPNAQVNDHFGFDVSITTDMAYVAMWHDHELPEGRKDLTQGGVVYAYNLDSCEYWHLSHEIHPPKSGQRDAFGVEIASNEDFLFIGGYRDDHDANEQHESMEAGAAFVLGYLPGNGTCDPPRVKPINAIQGNVEPTPTNDVIVDVVDVIVDNENSSTDVNETIEHPVISIDPNPNNGVFNVEVLNYKEGVFSLEVQDPLGRSVFKQRITEQITKVTLKDRARGPFIVIVSSSAGFVKRIVIVKRRKK